MNEEDDFMKKEVYYAKNAPIEILIDEAIGMLQSLKLHQKDDLVIATTLTRMERIIIRFGLDPDYTEEEVLHKMRTYRRGMEMVAPIANKESRN